MSIWCQPNELRFRHEIDVESRYDTLSGARPDLGRAVRLRPILWAPAQVFTKQHEDRTYLCSTQTMLQSELAASMPTPAPLSFIHRFDRRGGPAGERVPVARPYGINITVQLDPVKRNAYSRLLGRGHRRKKDATASITGRVLRVMSESIHEPIAKKKQPEQVPPPSRAPAGSSTSRQTLDAISARHAPASKNAEHARAALGFIERSARDGLAELHALTKDGQAPRDSLVVKIALEVGHASDDLATKLDELAPNELAALRTAANAAAEAVLMLRAWVRSRAPNANMVGHVESVLRDLDPALVRIGVAPVGARPTPALIDDETAESEGEKKRVTQASQDLLAAIETERGATVTGIRKFCLDQMIEDDDEPPSFVEAVAKSLLIAAVGHLIGEQVGKLLGNVAKRTNQATGAKTMERFVNVSTDFVQDLVASLSR